MHGKTSKEKVFPFISFFFPSLSCCQRFVACQYYKRLPFQHATWFRTLFIEWIPGLAVLLEKPSRRKELASYCLSHVLNSYWNRAKRTHKIQPRNWVSVSILALSFGILLQHFEEQPNAITSNMFGIAEYPVIVRK